LAVITKIGLDHTEILGKTIREITVDKAGIIKKNCKVALHFQSDEVYNIVRDICAENDAELYLAKKPEITVKRADIYGSEFDVSCEYFDYKGIKLKMPGEYQRQNAVCALTSVHALRASGVAVSDGAVRRGLYETVWPGRMELIKTAPRVTVLDGAHNADGIRELDRSLREYFGGGHLTVVFAAMKDKPCGEMVGLLTKNPDVKNIVFTMPEYKDRAEDPEKLASYADKRDGLRVFTEPDYKAAADLAAEITPEQSGRGVICFCGSLYLAGNVRAYIKQR
jgi:dihydrofolate synthase/folylpolyglutamate synthase